MPRKFFRSPYRINLLRLKIDEATNDMDRHRIHAHGLIDAAMEDGEITWQEAVCKKEEWDKRHGYS